MIDGPVLCIDATDVVGDEGILAASRAYDELACRATFVTSAFLVGAAAGAPAVLAVPAEPFSRQLDDAAGRGAPASVRVGLLADGAQVARVATLLDTLDRARTVVAPVTRIAGGAVMDRDAIDATRRELFPRARVVVLRAGDVARWTDTGCDRVEDLGRAAAAIREAGARAVLISGWAGEGRIVDLVDDDGRVTLLDTTRVAAPRIGGISAAHSAALSARLAAGDALEAAAATAQRYVGSRLRRGL